MRTALVLIAALAGAAGALGQNVDFDIQAGQACQITFPSPKGTAGDLENISTNGIDTATCDQDNGCGFPVSGARYLRVNGQNTGGIGELTTPGVAPTTLTVANEVYIQIPAGANTVTFSWDFYSQEGFQEPTYNDGMMVDAIDANCNQLGVLAFADTYTVQGVCQDGIGDPGNPPMTPPTACANIDASVTVFNGVEIDPLGAGPGPEVVTAAAIPAGSVYIRVAVWNTTDSSVQCTGVVDAVSFGMAAPPTYPGTGEDLITTYAFNSAPHAVVAAGNDVVPLPPATFVEIHHESPGGAFVGIGDFLSVGTVVATPNPLPSPFANIWLDPTTSFVIIGARITGFPHLLPFAGSGFSFVNSGTLAGLSLGIQAFVIDGSAANSIFASTNALELQLL